MLALHPSNRTSDISQMKLKTSNALVNLFFSPQLALRPRLLGAHVGRDGCIGAEAALVVARASRFTGTTDERIPEATSIIARQGTVTGIDVTQKPIGEKVPDRYEGPPSSR